MNWPRITVITPSFNQGEYIEDTLKSVLSQNYSNLEFLVFDGGSTDNTVEILKEYDKEITFWTSEKDKGQSDAINKGLRRATGEIITWLNSDDQLLPGSLETVAKAFQEDKDLFLLFGGTILFGPNFPEKEQYPSEENIRRRGCAGLPFAQPSSFFSRKLIEKYGILEESLHFGMDYAFFLPVFLFEKFKVEHQLFSKYLYHSTSKSVTQQAKFAQDYARIFGSLLATHPEGKPFLGELQMLGLLPKSPIVLPYACPLTKEELEEAYILNLHNQLIFYYQGFALSEAQRVAAILKTRAPEYVAKHPEINKVWWRSHLPVALLKLLRRN